MTSREPEISAESVEQRRAICVTCEFNKTVPLTRLGVCSACFCPIERKTARADASCPHSKW